MSEVKCSSCGHVEVANNQWVKCPECGYTMCNNCGLQNAKKEKQDLEKMRSGNTFERMEVHCPSCKFEMLRL